MSLVDEAKHSPKWLILLTAVWGIGLVWSGYAPFDRTTWWLEVFPVLIALPLLYGYRQRMPFTQMLYLVILVHGCILMMGGAYSYARVPLGAEIQSFFHLSRNPYDKIGHFFQGFCPALICREVFSRGQAVNGRKMRAFLAIAVVMLISSSYELIEWGAAVALGQGADEFLGTQGDPWDTQSDMGFALLGAVVALSCFSRWQDKQLLWVKTT